MNEHTKRNPGEKAYNALRREVQAARLRVSIDKRRGRKPSPKLIALAKLDLPATLPADVFAPSSRDTGRPVVEDKTTAEAQQAHFMH